jgi:peptidyl-prolyl cis-trans isomerase C
LYKIFFPILLLLLPFNCRKERSVVAKVNDSVLTLKELRETIPSIYEGKPPWEEMKSWVERWVESQMLYQEAMRRGLDKDGEVRKRIEEATKGILIAELLDREIEGGGEEEAFRYYRAHPKEFTRQEDEVRVSEIFVSGIKEAKKIIRRLREGEDFAELAAKYSLAPSAAKGGDLSYFTRDSLPAHLAKAASSTPLGNISEPIKGDDGYYIILVTDSKKKGTVRDFGLIRRELLHRLSVLQGRENLKDLLRKLKGEFEVEINYPLLASAGLADTSFSVGDTARVGKNRDRY